MGSLIRVVGICELYIDRARVVDLAERTGLKPLFKTNGPSLPGLSERLVPAARSQQGIRRHRRRPAHPVAATTRGFVLLP